MYHYTILSIDLNVACRRMYEPMHHGTDTIVMMVCSVWSMEYGSSEQRIFTGEMN